MKHQIKLEVFQKNISGGELRGRDATIKKLPRSVFNTNNKHEKLNYFVFASCGTNIAEENSFYARPKKSSFALNEQVMYSLSGFTLITIATTYNK